jgi:penicillin-binding protein 1A
MSILRLSLVLLQFIFMVVGMVYLIFSKDLPKIETITEIKLTNPMRIYSADNQLIGLFGTEKRQIVSYEDIPENLKNAIIAAEDGGFFDHSGVEITSLLRAAYGEISGRSLGGGGTITMQVVRNYVLSFERTYERKLKEIILAWKLEDYLNKEQIFELYFNKAFLGNRNYGFAAAYQYYFGKDFSDASIAESALLAGILQRPSSVNPVRNPIASKKRRDLILGRMLSRQFIDKDQFNAAKAVVVTGESFGPKITIEAEYIAEKIRAEIINRFGLKAYEEGMNVYTTIDSDMQTNAIKALRTNLYKYDQKYGWREEQVFKDFNFLIMRSAYQKEFFYKFPSKLRYEQIKEENFNKVQNLLGNRPTIDDHEPNIVIGIDNTKIQTLDAKLNLNNIYWSNGDYSWARIANSDGTRSPKPVSFRDFLELGSLVYIGEEKGKKILSQIPIAEASLVAVDALDAKLKAYVGGFDFSKSKFDRAANSKLLPGSSIKPFIYACAFENGLNPSTIFIDGPIIFDDDKLEGIWRPRNNSGEFYGPIRLRESLIQSLNIVSIKLVQSLGLTKTLDCFKKYKFQDEMLINDLSIALGTGTLNPLISATQYSSFINSGKHQKIAYIDRIEDVNGQIILDPNNNYSKKVKDFKNVSFPWLSTEKFDYTGSPMISLDANNHTQVMDERVAFLMSSILKESLQRNANRRGLNMPIENMGGKTGTTNDATSTWFSGYASNIVASAWVGKDDGSSLGEDEFGSTNALPIWLDFMTLSKDSLTDFEVVVPEGIAAIRIDKESGNVSKSFNNSYFEYFLEENIDDLLSSKSNNSELKEILN